MGFLSAFKHVGKGLLFAAIGLGIGVAFGSLVAEIIDREPLQVRVAIGYVFALIGWLLSVGLWDVLAREWFGLQPKPHDNQGWQRYFSFSLDHKVIGVQYLVTFMILFLLAGLLAMLIRVELLEAGQNFLSANDFMWQVEMLVDGSLDSSLGPGCASANVHPILKALKPSSQYFPKLSRS